MKIKQAFFLWLDPNDVSVALYEVSAIHPPSEPSPTYGHPMTKHSTVLLHAAKKLRFVLLATATLIWLLCLRSGENRQPTVAETIHNQASVDFFSPELAYRPIYKVIEDSYSVEDFAKKPLAEKCYFYFERLHAYNPNWWTSPKLGTEYTHENLQKSEDLVHMNIYNHCFMGNATGSDPTAYEKLHVLFNNIDTRVYPYLSGKLPLFQHWTGSIHVGPPLLEAYPQNVAESVIDESTFAYDPSQLKTWESSSIYPKDKPFWNHYKDKLNNVGIVLSVNDALVEETMALLSLLRTLNNELPIEFLHRGDLSSLNKYRLFQVARAIKAPTTLSTFPKQDIWFVDVSFCLSDNYQNEFPKFFNKMLAYGFNSFKTMIMLDTDVVLFQTPASLLDTSQFKQSGTLFFKDRNVDMHMSAAYIDFLKNTSPNYIDSFIFGLIPVREETWEGEYFKERYFHYMESGVVVVNRDKYWNAVILSLHLSFIQSTMIGSWGDKEHFWVSMLLSGLDDYKFDDYWTASVGSPIRNEDGVKYHKICSAHPSHVLSDNNELSWINSGIINCPKVSHQLASKDFDLLKEISNPHGRSFANVQELEKFYTTPIAFDAFIIPPLAKNNIGNSNPEDGKYSNLGLQQLSTCKGYTWCSYDTIGEGQTPEWKGIYKHFTGKQIQWYNYIAESYVKAS